MKTNDQEMTNKELQIWIAGELKSFRSHVDGEFKAIRAELKGVESRLDTKIGGVESRLDTKIEVVEARLGERIGGVEARLGSLESRVDGLMIGVAVPVASPFRWRCLFFWRRRSGLGIIWAF